ncbi:MAG: hypothetical protein NTZ98_20055 [Acidobacteria bacterium]|nr:hypothetical protein [Acidobacteriota bacterium]
MRIAIMGLAMVLAARPAAAQIGNIVVTSGASFEKGMPPAGSIASIFCTGLKGINGIVTATGYPLPVELAAVRVTIGGVAAPLFAVADLGGYQQVNAQVPWEAGYATDIVVAQSGEQARLQAQYLGSAAGDFFRLPDGSGAFQHADFSLVSAANPARGGEVIIGYLTDLSILPSTTTPPAATGQPAPANPPAVVNQFLKSGSPPRFQISVGDGPSQKLADPVFLGLAPGLVGVYQVNFVLPEGLTAGSQAVRLAENRCVSGFPTACAAVVLSGYGLAVPMAVR